MQWEYGVFVCARIEACHASRPELKEYWLAWFLLLGSTLNFFCASESHDQSRCSFVHKNIIELLWKFNSDLKRKPLGFVATFVLRPFSAPIGPRPFVERCPLPVVTTFDLFLDCRITLQARKHHSRCEALVAQCGMQMADGVFEACWRVCMEHHGQRNYRRLGSLEGKPFS